MFCGVLSFSVLFLLASSKPIAYWHEPDVMFVKWRSRGEPKMLAAKEQTLETGTTSSVAADAC